MPVWQLLIEGRECGEGRGGLMANLLKRLPISRARRPADRCALGMAELSSNLGISAVPGIDAWRGARGELGAVVDRSVLRASDPSEPQIIQSERQLTE